MMEPTPATRARAFANRAGTRSGPPGKKTNRRALILALLLGGVAAVLIVFYLGSRAAGGDEKEVPMLEVVVAARDIESGQKITDSMVEVRVLPTEAVTPNAARSKAAVVGQTLRYPVAKGEQLSNIRLVEPPKVQALSFQIPEGLRAFTIPVSVNNTPAGLMAPGDHVDVLVTGPLKAFKTVPQLADAAGNAGAEGTATITLLQDVQVLAVQQDYVDNGVPYDPSVRGEPSKSGKVGYMTLALTPEQGQLLWQVKGGEMTLSLRPFGDDVTLDLEPAVSKVRVVVAAREIVAGQVITADMVESEMVLATEAGPDAATSLDQVVGQVSRVAVSEGEVISINAAALGRVQAISFQIPEGYRGFTMPVDVKQSPSALIVPGDYVDVLVALDLINFDQQPAIPEEGEAAEEDWKGAVTLLQNIRVLAVEQNYVDHGVPYDSTLRGAPPDGDGAGFLTLAVTPKQAQLLWLAVAKNATMTVTLRPYGDDETKVLNPVLEPVQWSAIPREGLP